jgi:hypothetical protein
MTYLPCTIRKAAGWILAPLAVVAVLCWTGCAPGRGSRVSVGAESGVSAEIRADAYLFEARLKRDGKPTTFQLEVYRTDTLLGLSGKGYLGKGALKGRLTSDSLEVYFPSTHEYLYEATGDLADSSDCRLAVAQVRFLDLFHRLPDSADMPSGLYLTTDTHDPDKPVYTVHAYACAWRVEVTYDRQDGVWCIREFSYTDGDQTSLSGQRLRYRNDATVKVNRFAAVIPPGAVRITR